MTNRLNALVVILEKDIREDDAEVLISAIRQLRGVLTVKKNVADHIEGIVAVQRERQRITQKVWDALRED
jgi:hypothetical protein